MSPFNFLELLPIFLAVVAIVLCSYRIRNVRRHADLLVYGLSIIGSILLIVAQSSWWVSFVIQGDLIGTWFANQVWLLFNTLMMLMVIINAYPRQTK